MINWKLWKLKKSLKFPEFFYPSGIKSAKGLKTTDRQVFYVWCAVKKFKKAAFVSFLQKNTNKLEEMSHEIFKKIFFGGECCQRTSETASYSKNNITGVL